MSNRYASTEWACLSVKCLSFVVRQLVFAICSQGVLVGASVRNMQGCTMSTGQQPVCITKNWQRPFWPQFVLDGRTPEHVRFFCMSHGTTKTKQTFLLFLTCMLHEFLEEMCVAGGTVLVLTLHVSGRRQFKRGTRDV